ncbi:putative hydroxymethylpyrimidine transport system permease protein [Angulomicrobium tetraedrale]|uniref:Putative hydroxymethylpyrimidine transport system permease protein n=1 Tax=Ancylobacter tetraedralis TaxID=217068 RepID=A0A839YYZ8_9HYPH|nr:ABC transporter permease [Ancylobacter tetraedralis]MBB3769744.1 putative hydroxymethylpyrimidine transport system permease protein [Ancylobacter tetraedralis]
MAVIGRTLAITLILLGLWEAAVRLMAIPAYILPGPLRIAVTGWNNAAILAHNGAITLGEMLLGLVCGSALGIACALAMAASPLARRAMRPVLLVAQALPVFAIAPLLVIWFGFGLASKIVMASLIIFFPVASAFHDGLARTEQGLVDLARLGGVGTFKTLRYIRIPAALPALASGLRVATAVAPIGAVVGEWVGASAGLGYLMIYSNARMQTDMVFAALAILLAVALTLFTLVDRGLTRLLPWAPETAES